MFQRFLTDTNLLCAFWCSAWVHLLRRKTTEKSYWKRSCELHSHSNSYFRHPPLQKHSPIDPEFIHLKGFGSWFSSHTCERLDSLKAWLNELVSLHWSTVCKWKKRKFRKRLRKEQNFALSTIYTY